MSNMSGDRCVIGVEVTWLEMRPGDVTWSRMMLGEVTCSEIKPGEVTWSEMSPGDDIMRMGAGRVALQPRASSSTLLNIDGDFLLVRSASYESDDGCWNDSENEIPVRWCGGRGDNVAVELLLWSQSDVAVVDAGPQFSFTLISPEHTNNHSVKTYFWRSTSARNEETNLIIVTICSQSVLHVYNVVIP